MIKIRRNRAADGIHPDFMGPKLIAKLTVLAKAKAKAGSGGVLAFEKAIGDWKKTKDFLKRESSNKCAYCESWTANVAHGDVEHFRPKSVYWWLALCVDNYVFSCQICNQTYKGDDFPINGRKLRGPRLPRPFPRGSAAQLQVAARLCPDPSESNDDAIFKLWSREKADLPHPYLENPEQLFAWRVGEVNEEVLIEAQTSADDRAARAIQAATDYLGLNRDILVQMRFLVYASLKAHLKIWKLQIAGVSDDAAIEILRMCDGKFQFAGMSRYFSRLAGFPLPSYH